MLIPYGGPVTEAWSCGERKKKKKKKKKKMKKKKEREAHQTH